MKAALLDVNVLLALAWPNHQHHSEAHEWFNAQARHGWASCAFTQLSFIRLSANPAYTPAAVSPPEAATLLQELLRHRYHRFWPSLPGANPKIYSISLGHQQVNDAYLAILARHQKGRFVTFDSRSVPHAPDVVELIST
jgi:toxin-antitoxin system PIN domain toxin